MSEREVTIRTAIITYFPMLIAVLSLVTSIFNGYLNNKFVNFIQRNLSRTEYLHTCKDIIDAYFQVKFRVGLVRDNALVPAPTGSAQIDAVNAVSKFGALGTYLANLRDEPARERYTQITRELEPIVRDAGKSPTPDLDKLFEPADRMFAEMNSDCVKTAKQ
jgi:hypothetical protein